MQRFIAAFTLAWFLLLPATALAANSAKSESGRVTVTGTSTVIFQFSTPVPAGARRIKGQGEALAIVNRTAGSTIWCNVNVDSSLSGAAVASDTTPNQYILDDLTPGWFLDGFNPQKLVCISDGSAVLDWSILEK